ncbi:hypothetical protein ACFL5Q_02235 [Planctomycetota bacterium]
MSNEHNEPEQADARKYAVIAAFAQAHETHCDWKPPVPYVAPPTEGLYSTPDVEGHDWRSAGFEGPEWAHLTEEADDGADHDKTTIRLWHAETAAGRLAIYSYEDGGTSHCDVLTPDEDPGSIRQYLREAAPEWLSPWMKEYADMR